MKTNKNAFLPMLMLFLAFTGCAHHIVNNPETPYDSMGMIEEKVSVKAPLLSILTLGIKREHSFKCLTKKLNRRLERMALHKYGADAVNNITYWPAPDSDALVDYLYARGEMIRYKKFNETYENASLPAA
jgi:hypothetical protein